MIKNEILHLLQKAIEKIGVKDINIQLDHPTNLEFGDFSTNIALKLAKKYKKNPMDLANEIVQGIPSMNGISKIDIIKPGFINFKVTGETLVNEIKGQLSCNFLVDSHEKKKILLEFGQPNTHKLPHIGHLFSYIYGNSIARIFEFMGDEVYRVNYQGDVGLHVAKCLFVLKNKKKEIDEINNSQISDREKLGNKIRLLQRSYEEGSRLYDQDKKAKEGINTLNKEIYEKDPSIMNLWNDSRSWSINYYKYIEAKIGIDNYKSYYFESETAEIGKKIVEENIPNIFEKSNGAVIFRGEKYDLHTRVFINSIGLPTYEAKDIGLMTKKQDDYSFDKSFVTTATEQNEYWRVITKALEMIYPNLKGKIEHIGFGMIKLVSGKMASRTGNIVNLPDFLGEQENAVIDSFGSLNSTEVSLAAVKYAFLKSEVKKDIIYDKEKSIAQDGDSGPYLLYTYVRCKSVLGDLKPKKPDNLGNITKEEEDLLRILYRLPEVINNAYDNYSPHFIANYLFNLAQKFNLFYQKCPILKADEETKNFRLFLTNSTSEVIKKGLELLGIETVDKM